MRNLADQQIVGRRFSGLLAGLVIVTAMVPAAMAGDAMDWSQDPATGCHFVAPTSLTRGPAFWMGDCPGDKASGVGMLRRRDGDRAGPAFFGEMSNGVPKIGVVDLDGTYRAGTFENGDIGTGPELEPQVRIDAVRLAAKAARAVSARYAAEGNTASAKHYQSVAKMWDLQDDW
jgi:hypothetical protein